MSEILQLDYYYGIEAEQFSFYRVPRLLIKDERFKKLSSDAKLLYGLMLDRMSLSIKNEWFDEDNRAYIIYTIDSIMEDLGCGKEKAVKVLADREDIRSEAAQRLAVYKEFAPEDMSVDQIRQVIAEVLAELGIDAPSPKDKGAIMKVLMPRVKGKADGKVVNETLAGMFK